MNFRLNLEPPHPPRIAVEILNQPLAFLDKLIANNSSKARKSRVSVKFNNRKELLRRRFQSCDDVEAEFLLVQNEVVGWPRLMLGLYLDQYGADWLPPFNESTAKAILENGNKPLNSTRRWQLSLLYFINFDKLPALEYVSEKLKEAYVSAAESRIARLQCWSQHREQVFSPKAPQQLAAISQDDDTLEELTKRYNLPTKGVFAARLRQIFLLEKLHRCGFGDEPDVLKQIEQNKHTEADDCLLLGAAALKIIINRVIDNGNKWPATWRTWISRLGCDPRMGRHMAECSKWWGWATDSQWQVAVQGVIGLSLEFFFTFLDGTVSREQWLERKDFLLCLFREGKILDARLALNDFTKTRLPVSMRDKWNIAQLTNTTQDTCIIVLKCCDGVYMIEGTHSFALRAFHDNFPLRGFWERIRMTYSDRELRISAHACPVYVRHQGEWVDTFLDQLGRRFSVWW